MSEKRNVSSLSDHRLHKKKGIVATPLNDVLRDQLKLSSWTKERMPEYIWLGLILIYYGRNEGFKKSGQILYEISKKVKSLSHPRLSMIFNLSEDDQRIVYEIIIKFIDKKILSPLTVIYRFSRYPIFNRDYHGN